MRWLLAAALALFVGWCVACVVTVDERGLWRPIAVDEREAKLEAWRRQQEGLMGQWRLIWHRPRPTFCTLPSWWL